MKANNLATKISLILANNCNKKNHDKKIIMNKKPLSSIDNIKKYIYKKIGGRKNGKGS